MMGMGLISLRDILDGWEKRPFSRNLLFPSWSQKGEGNRTRRKGTRERGKRNKEEREDDRRGG